MQFPSTGRAPSSLRGRRILVVEDQVPVALLIEDALLAAGVAVAGRASGPAALAVIVEAPPGAIDAAVVDLDMGGGSAHPVIAALVLRRIPCVLTTGYATAALEGLEGLPVLRRPFDGQRLVAALATLPRRAGW